MKKIITDIFENKKVSKPKKGADILNSSFHKYYNARMKKHIHLSDEEIAVCAEMTDKRALQLLGRSAECSYCTKRIMLIKQPTVKFNKQDSAELFQRAFKKARINTEQKKQASLFRFKTLAIAASFILVICGSLLVYNIAFKNSGEVANVDKDSARKDALNKELITSKDSNDKKQTVIDEPEDVKPGYAYFGNGKESADPANVLRVLSKSYKSGKVTTRMRIEAAKILAKTDSTDLRKIADMLKRNDAETPKAVEKAIAAGMGK